MLYDSILLVIPFITLLTMIATGPLLYPHFWHRFYPYIAIGLACIVIGYYLFILKDTVHPIESLVDYIQFIFLISALYMVSGNVLIRLHCKATPYNNLAILFTGALLSNIIGTTGSSMLLIRPYIKLNKKHIRAYHIVFFIFMVSNVGGALTPIADPPLFIGLLKGVPFFWTVTHNFLAWLLALSLLGGVFFWFDKNNVCIQATTQTETPIQIIGKRYAVLFLFIVASLFLDPNQLNFLPYIPHHGHKISFVRELILFTIILGVYLKGDKAILTENNFSFAPLKEVIFIFMGIFGTMMPAIELVGDFAQKNSDYISPNSLYWSTGILSSFLDNAPTYFNFLTAGMSAKGLHVSSVQDVIAYSKLWKTQLQATSIASVFFGAMTYIGNGPNFMVKAIAEEQEIAMPSFVGYIWQFAIRYLLPILGVIWLCCFAFSNMQ